MNISEVNKVLKIDTNKFTRLFHNDDGDLYEHQTLTLQMLPLSVGESLEVVLNETISIQSTIEDDNSNDIRAFTIHRTEHNNYIISDYTVNQQGAMRISACGVGVDYVTMEQLPKNCTQMSNGRCHHILIILVTFFKMVKDNGLVPFTASRVNAKGKKVSTSLSNPDTVVYLGKAPSKCGSTGNGGELKFGYPRTEHRRTLKHERFSDHPKFMIYKGVLVKQSWCGPKTYRTKIRIYKLWEPSGYDISGS
jgi:hypothetical protein